MPPFVNRLIHRRSYVLLVFVVLLAIHHSSNAQAINGRIWSSILSTPETSDALPEPVILAGLDGAAEKTVTIDDYANLYVPECIRASNHDSRIAFIVDGQIYVADIDRFQSPEAIPHGDLWANCVTWSNDDRSLYVLGSPTTGEDPVQIYHLPLEGDPAPDQLSFDDRGISSIKLSPDGKRLLFESGDGRINSDRQTLEARQRYEWRPPHVIDGLIFKRDGSGYQTTKAEKDIHVLDIDTKQPLQLTGTRHQDADGTWSPDGKQIAFIRDVSGGSEYHSDLWIMPSKAKDGVAGTKLTETPCPSKRARLERGWRAYRLSLGGSAPRALCRHPARPLRNRGRNGKSPHDGARSIGPFLSILDRRTVPHLHLCRRRRAASG